MRGNECGSLPCPLRHGARHTRGHEYGDRIREAKLINTWLLIFENEKNVILFNGIVIYWVNRDILHTQQISTGYVWRREPPYWQMHGCEPSVYQGGKIPLKNIIMHISS